VREAMCSLGDVNYKITEKEFHVSSLYYGGQKILAVIVCQFKKIICNPYFIVIIFTVLIMNVIFWVVNSKLKIILPFLLHRTFTSGYLCTIALILFIHVGFFEYLSFKQFKLIVKMTRIESGVTIPKGLFTLYLNVKKVTAKIFWPP
jgi:preprotein translocase subunit SecE